MPVAYPTMHDQSLELRDLLAELLHQLEHLRRSQAELAEALQIEPSDDDFKAAMVDNEAVILRKEQQVRETMALLRQIDPAYRAEAIASGETPLQPVDGLSEALPLASATSLRSSSNTSPIATAVIASVNDSAEIATSAVQISAESDHVDTDGGIYL